MKAAPKPKQRRLLLLKQWKLLDFAELKRSSISFFDMKEHESANSRWSRARTRAARIGKGLSENENAQKLALKYWLEAVSDHTLDVGEGKEVNLEKCPRPKLQEQCVKYLGPMERKAYEVVIEDEKLLNKESGELLHTTEDAKWIFVLSTSKTLYVGQQKKGTFHHSSFLAGGVTAAAGRLIVKNGILKAVWPRSKHYRPTEENFKDFLTFLGQNNVDLSDVKVLCLIVFMLEFPTMDKHQAALRLQKVYKSFRTRRKLADCAVLVEQSWWKLLDFVELKRSSISFFDMEEHESANSRWSRAKTRAAKIGKGLSENDKAQKLALDYWLEAVSDHTLDIGEGKEVNLEKCPRPILQRQRIKYLGPMERKAYEVVIEDGKLLYKESGELLINTTEDGTWIFVLSSSKTLYVGKKKKGTFQHSSFLAGGVATAAGRLIVKNGILKAVWPRSRHYQPTEENLKYFLTFLRQNNVDLTDVKTSPVDEEDNLLDKQSNSKRFRKDKD
ncbi:unnamed protein product [Dovyalis caffra]|uniref:Calmodulin-binding family protein n=1 Tax=Dovyalis caffra TaxID=77055 RepID=A0AAV1RS47_9ROSI|nr:unnamed protein product [Dovyalis caffra]